MEDIASRVSPGDPLYRYLGHFAQHQYMCQGHNDVGGLVESSEGEGLVWDPSGTSYTEDDPAFGNGTPRSASGGRGVTDTSDVMNNARASGTSDTMKQPMPNIRLKSRNL